MSKVFPVPSLASSPVWPIPGDVPDLNSIVDAQAQTIADQEALLHAYQTVLSNAQAQQIPTTATGTGNSTGSPNLTVSAPITGTIQNGAAIAGSGVPAQLTITGQTSGPAGGAGIYTTSASTTLSNVALTFTNPVGPAWPAPQDAPTLNTLAQMQAMVIRTQVTLLQQYQEVLNTSQTPPPATGP